MESKMASGSVTSWLYRIAVIGPMIVASALAPAAHAEDRVAPVASPVHPMDGLTADEIRTGVDVLRGAGKLDDAARIVSFTIDENPKDEVRTWRVGQPFARKAIATLLSGGRLYEARIDRPRSRSTRSCPQLTCRNRTRDGSLRWPSAASPTFRASSASP
jgi:primary-amine oxidase